MANFAKDEQDAFLGSPQDTRAGGETSLPAAASERERDVLYRPLMDLERGVVAGFSAEPEGGSAAGPFRSRPGVSGPSCVASEGRSAVSGADRLDPAACPPFRLAERALRGFSRLAADVKRPGLMLLDLDPWPILDAGKNLASAFGAFVARRVSGTDGLVLCFDVDRLMERPAEALDLGIGLKRLGFGVAADIALPEAAPSNFLELFPADVLRLRLDGFWAGADPPSASLGLSAINAFADNLLMDVLVEGVENPAQYRLVKSLGCRYAQGGYFSRPLAMDRAREFFLATANSPRLSGG